jgi:hypothetical protein
MVSSTHHLLSSLSSELAFIYLSSLSLWLVMRVGIQALLRGFGVKAGLSQPVGLSQTL